MLLWNSFPVLSFEGIIFFMELRRLDASAILISFPCNNSITGRVKSRIYLVRTKVAIKSKEAINL